MQYVVTELSALLYPRIIINHGHWNLSEKCGFEREVNWYDHRPDPLVCDSGRYKQTAILDTVSHADIVLNRVCPFDTRTNSKEREY